MSNRLTVAGCMSLVLRKPVLLSCLLATPTLALNAQQDAGTIGGTVSDPNGGLLPNAKVSIKNDATGLEYSTTSNAKGFYRSQPLPPGSYTVVIVLEGFGTATTRNVVVDAAAHVTSSAQLSVGGVESTIVVEAAAPALNTVDAQIGNTVDTRAVQELPVNGRSVLALATLSPGVVSAAGAVNQGFTNRGTQASAIRISGGVPGGNNNLLDGVTNLQNYLGEVAINTKADSVKEFRIMSGVIPAQFGYTSGGVINVITQSGANRFHGSAYEFFRNDYLDATVALPKTTKPPLRFNNYGATIGGPIVRDRAFFFTNFEEYRYVTGSAIYYSVPTLQQRTGNFSDLRRVVNGVCTPYRIFDPSSGSATTQRRAFTNNQIPTAQQDKVALAALTTFVPAPNNSVGSYDSCTNANNYLASPKLASNERTVLGRVDYRVSDRDTIFGRYAYYKNYTNNGTAGLGPLFFRDDTLENQTLMLAESHIFSPSLLNDIRASALRSAFPFQTATANKNFPQQLGLPGVSGEVAPILLIAGLPALNGTIGFRASTTFELLDDLTKTVGAHTLHIGFDGRFVESYNRQSGAAAGQYSFSANNTAEGSDTALVTANGNVGSAFATFLTGTVANALVQTARGIAFRQYQFAGYAQDDWHATSRLTVNAGLRWDFQQQATEKKNGLGNFDITQTNPLTGYAGAVRFAGIGEGRNFVRENWNDWGPRVGFALVLTDDNKTALRGGYGIYYPTIAQVSYNQAAGNTNGFGQLNTTYSAPTTFGSAFQFTNGVPTPPQQPVGAALGQLSYRGQTGYYIFPRARTPQSMQYTLTVSRELPHKVVLDVSYLGNHGRNLNLGNINLNTLDPSFFSLGATALNSLVANPYAGRIPENATLNAATISRANLLRPYPYMSSVIGSFPRASHFDANFLYVTLQRRAAEGLQFQSAYTYGKVLGLPVYTDVATAAGITQTATSIQNARNLDGEYSVDAIDVTHRGVAAVLYDLPFGRSRRFLNKGGWLDRVVGGFQWNTTMTVESGRPLAFSGANNSGIAIRPNLDETLLRQNPVGYTLDRYRRFNYQAFTNPANYTFGNAPRYYSKLRGPGVINFDMSVFKTTHITETTSLELRLEAYNVFNHVNLGMPNTAFSGTSVNVNNNMGLITSSYPARTLQLAAKFHF